MNPNLLTELRLFMADDERRSAALLSSGYQGSAYLFDDGGAHRLVIKEAGGGVLTAWFHRMMLRREAHVYQLLRDVVGVPHSPGMLDEQHLLLEYIDGESLKDERSALADPEIFYARLRQVISDIHAAGVAHGDLKRKENILVTRNNEPVVIDFGTAVTRNGNPLDQMLYPLLRRFDDNAWIKVKYARDYKAIAPEDLHWYQPTIVERVFQLILRVFRKLTFRQARKRRQRARLEKH
jgi:predicted Ser/Thr protein kinase